VRYYEIRCREEKGTWRSVATLAPQNIYAQNGSLLRYRWTDHSVLPQTLYLYQVIAISPNGEEMLYSNAVEAMISGEGGIVLELRPNPSQGSSWLVASHAGLPVQVVNVHGQVVWEGQTVVGNLELPGELAAGVYVVRVADRHLRWVKLR